MKRAACSIGVVLGAALRPLVPPTVGGQILSPGLLPVLARPWTGDLDGMVKCRAIRTLLV